MTIPGPTLTPLGTSPAWYNPGSAASGYVLEHDGTRVLIDCGSGVISKYLEEFGTNLPIDAVLISHVHADHVFDLIPLTYGLQIGSLQGWSPPELWLPPGARERLQRLVSTWDGPARFFEDAFSVRTYHPGKVCRVGSAELNTIEVPHYIESYAMRLACGDAVLAYSGDLGPTDAIAPFVAGSDLFLCEAAMPEGVPATHTRGHLSASDAGRIAAEAAVHSLLLSHIPVENGIDVALHAARSQFSGPVELAVAGTPYAVAGRLARVN